MNKSTSIYQKVYDFIKESDGAHIEQIRTNTKLSRIMVQNSICFLLGEQSIFLWNDFGNCKVYKIMKKNKKVTENDR